MASIWHRIGATFPGPMMAPGLGFALTLAGVRPPEARQRETVASSSGQPCMNNVIIFVTIMNERQRQKRDHMQISATSD